MRDTAVCDVVSWRIAVLLAAATALNYLDRQTLPVLIGELSRAFAISPQDYSRMQAAFLLSYALMYALGGRILDRLGTKLGYAIFMAWWSAATIAHGFANSVVALGLCRFLLGLGEGAGFPASGKAVAESFSTGQRSFVFGFFNTGSSLGAVIAPPLIAILAVSLGWRWVFFLSGGAGFVWLLFWHFGYPSPPASQRRPAPEPWLPLLLHRQTVVLLCAKFVTDAAWYFFIFWLPKYLNDVRGLDTKSIGAYAWIPYAFAGAGSLLGGISSGWLLHRTGNLDLARKAVLAVSALLMPVSLAIASVPLNLAILFFGVAMFGHQCWSSLIQTVVADIFPARSVGAVAGIIGCAGSLGGFLYSLIVGELVSGYGGYPLAFVIAGLCHPLGLALLYFFLGPIAPDSRLTRSEANS